MTGVAAVEDVDRDTVLRLAAAVEADSEHPLARAIGHGRCRSSDVTAVATGFRSMTGRGVEASVDGARVAVGGPALLRELSVDPPPDARWTATWRRGAPGAPRS